MENQQHARLMDQNYRWQRHCYDLTRKYYLFGRDRTIEGLGPMRRNASILEIGCGTGRNLRKCLHRFPGAQAFGVDISAQMLTTARQKLSRDGLAERAQLGRGDATNFDAKALFERDEFDRILLPYCLSMMPGWQAALQHAMTLCAQSGSVHVVDFGQLEGYPDLFRRALRAWLAKFDVTPRTDLPAVFSNAAHRAGLAVTTSRPMGRGYAILLKASRR